MTCFLCSSPELSTAFAADPLRAVQLLFNGMESQQVTVMDILAPPAPQPIVGTPLIERCARVAEAHCSACHQTDCAYCQVAADIRRAADRIHEERDAELDALEPPDLIGTAVERITSKLCTKHSEFGRMLLAEQYRRRAWEDRKSLTSHSQ